MFILPLFSFQYWPELYWGLWTLFWRDFFFPKVFPLSVIIAVCFGPAGGEKNRACDPRWTLLRACCKSIIATIQCWSSTKCSIYIWLSRMFSFHLHEQGWKRDVFSLSSNCSDAKDMEAHKPCSVHGTHTFLRQWVVGFGVWWLRVAVKIQWLIPLAVFQGLLSDEDASGGVWPVAPSVAPRGHLTLNLGVVRTQKQQSLPLSLGRKHWLHLPWIYCFPL